MDSVAPARGFRFWSEGPQLLAMGDEARAAGGSRTLKVMLPRPARLRLLQDGKEIASAAHAAALEHRVDSPGVYRVEAYLPAHGRERTWIISNPIYLR
jgi:hypothetical protein